MDYRISMNKKKNSPAQKKSATDEIVPTTSSSYNKSLYLIIFLFSFLLYANTITHDFALDDVAVIQQNKFTKQGLAGIDDMLLTFYWQGYWDTNAGLYRPLSLITFAIEYELFGENPHEFHFVNVLLYSLICTLLFFVLRQLLKQYNPLIPLISTLLFAAHPLHTEVVANIKSRDELLSVFFFLISLLFLLRFTEDRRNKNIIISLCCYFLSLFSKEGGMVFLGIFPVTLYFFTDEPVKKIARTTSLFLIPAALFFALHSYVIAHAPTVKIIYTYWDNSLVAAEGISRIATAIYMMGKYFLLLFYPHPLSYDYSFNQVPATTFSDGKVLLSLLAIALLVFVAIKGLKKKNIFSYGIIFFFITISLVSNIFMLIGATMADRFLFMPSLGFCLIIGLLLTQLTKSNTSATFNSLRSLVSKNVKLFSIVFIILSFYSYKTITRNADWKNNFTLFEKDVNASPNSSRTQYNYGTELLGLYNNASEQDTAKRNSLLNRSILHLERSVNIDTNAHQSYLNLASAYYQKKNYNGAIKNAMQNLRVNPNEIKAHSILGNAHYRLNMFDKAIEHLNIAIKNNSYSDDTYVFLGGAYFGKGDYNNAITAFNKALELKPNKIDAYTNLGAAYGSIKDFDNAIKTFKTSLTYNPNNAQTYYYIALTFNNMGSKDSAEVYLAKYNALVRK